MRGVSEIIAIVLILMIVIALVGSAYVFFSSTLSGATSAASSSLNSTTNSMLSQFSIESMSVNSLYVRNIGQSDISNLSVYVNDAPVNFNVTPSVIKRGQIGTVAIYDFVKQGDNIRITTSQGASASKSAPDPCSQAVLCLHFDEGQGTTAYDSSPYHNDGTLVSSPTWVAGKYGNALSFNGASNYVNRASGVSYPTNAITIDFWMKINAQTAFFQHPLGFGGGHSATFYVVPNSYNLAVKFQTLGGVDVEPTIATLDTNWHHIAVTYDGSNLKAYVDGAQSLNRPTSGAISYGDSSFFIGTTGSGVTPNGNWFNGIVDEVRVFNRAIY